MPSSLEPTLRGERRIGPRPASRGPAILRRDGAIARGEAVILVPGKIRHHVNAIVQEVGTSCNTREIVGIVTALRDAGLQARTNAFVMVLQDEVDDTRDRLRPIDRRRSARDNLNFFNEVVGILLRSTAESPAKPEMKRRPLTKVSVRELPRLRRLTVATPVPDVRKLVLVRVDPIAACGSSLMTSEILAAPLWRISLLPITATGTGELNSGRRIREPVTTIGWPSFGSDCATATPGWPRLDGPSDCCRIAIVVGTRRTGRCTTCARRRLRLSRADSY